MLLKDVLKNIEILEHKGNLDIDITNISSDSRLIRQNGFFFAITGYKLKGTDFIESAIKNGATSVLEPELEPWGQRTCYIADPEGNLIEIGSWNKVYEQKDL